jgi:hypothetical protein
MVKVLGHLQGLLQEMHHVYRCEILAHDIDANIMFMILRKFIYFKPISMKKIQFQKNNGSTSKLYI